MIVFFSGGRGVVVTLTSDGAVVAREHGGPVYARGIRDNSIEPTVRVWRWREDGLYERTIARLRDAGFPTPPSVEWPLLAPDERPSWIHVHGDDGVLARMGLPHWAVQASPSLAKIDAELDAICYRTQRERSTEEIPNPELGEWPEADRRRLTPEAQAERERERRERLERWEVEVDAELAELKRQLE